MRLFGLALVVVLLYVAYSTVTIDTQHSPTMGAVRDLTSLATPPLKPDGNQAARANFKIADFKWSARFSIMTATFTFQNDNEIAVKDVEVRCDHTAPSGTPIDSNSRTIYEIFKPKSRRTIKEFNMGFIHSQAATSSCYVRSLIAIN